MRFIGVEGMPIEVLLVEDSPGDVRLTQEAFHGANRTIHLQLASDGGKPWPFSGVREIQRMPRPDLILLDLNLPEMDGREVLVLIKAEEDLKSIPTVIFTPPMQKWIS
jgi:chemotaxis family two-component system response regulator Rcp1